MADSIEEMDRAINCLSIAVDEEVAKDIWRRWQAVKAELVTLRAKGHKLATPLPPCDSGCCNDGWDL